MTRAFVLLTVALASAMSAGAEQRSITGVISESMCRTNHAAMKLSPDSKCVTECVRTAKNVVYVLIAGKDVYRLDDQRKPAAFAARKVTVKGVLDEKTATIAVASIEAAR